MALTESPSYGAISRRRRDGGRALVAAATVLFLAVGLLQALNSAGLVPLGLKDWRPTLYAFLLWSVALGVGQVMMRGDAGLKALFILPAALFTASDYVQATREHRRMMAEMAPLYARFDAFVTAGMGEAPPIADYRSVSFWQKPSLLTAWNVTGQPVLALPNGFGRSGLPLGMQILGRPFGARIPTSLVSGQPHSFVFRVNDHTQRITLSEAQARTADLRNRPGRQPPVRSAKFCVACPAATHGHGPTHQFPCRRQSFDVSTNQGQRNVPRLLVYPVASQKLQHAQV